MGFPIRKSSDQSSFAAPQGLSQRTTSFIASQRQGIHRMPLRHLIALMIDVRRSAAPDKDVRKTISIPNPPKTPEGAPTDRRRCLPNTSDPLEAAGAASSLGTCSLFTMSKHHRTKSPTRSLTGPKLIASCQTQKRNEGGVSLAPHLPGEGACTGSTP